MRTIEDHKTNAANEAFTISVLDLPGAGGACHEYMIETDDGVTCRISFQNGPIAEVGVNGVTQEALLAIVADRLRSFQAGPYACTENAMALGHVNEAMKHLQSRTKRRTEAGIKGTSKPDPVDETDTQAAQGFPARS